MMASALVVETSVNTNNSPSQDDTTNLDDHSNHNNNSNINNSNINHSYSIKNKKFKHSIVVCLRIYLPFTGSDINSKN